MSLYYSAATGGFYDTTIHASLFIEQIGTDANGGEISELVPDPAGPIADAIAVTDDQHAALMSAQSSGKVITPDATGHPQASDPPALTNAQLADAARAQRDALLTACDWTQANDSPLDATTKSNWATYRKSLRNVPQQTGFPTTITWPTVP